MQFVRRGEGVKFLPPWPSCAAELTSPQREQLRERLGVPERVRDQQVVLEREGRERVALDLGQQDVAVKGIDRARVQLGEPAQRRSVFRDSKADLDVVRVVAVQCRERVVARDRGMEEHGCHHRFDYASYYITSYTRLVVMHDWERPAPGDLAQVQALVNTLDLETGEDVLSAAWLEENGLGPAGDLQAVRELREGLRGVLLSHNGVEIDPPALRGSVTVAFDADGTPRLTADDAIGQVLAIVAVAAADGTWERLKACPADACHMAFYDFSRNHSRTWCTMSVCGNRAKARSYRARQPKAGA